MSKWWDRLFGRRRGKRLRLRPDSQVRVTDMSFARHKWAGGQVKQVTGFDGVKAVSSSVSALQGPGDPTPDFEETFADYSSTAELLAHPSSIWAQSEDLNVGNGRVILDTTTGYGVSDRSMRYHYVSRTDPIYAQYTGVISSGTPTTIIDNTAAWTVNQWQNMQVYLPGSSEAAGILSNTANTLTLKSSLVGVIAGESYRIFSGCGEYTIARTVDLRKFTTVKDRLWVEMYVKFSSNFDTIPPASWACTSNPDYKFVFLNVMGQVGRFAYLVGNAASRRWVQSPPPSEPDFVGSSPNFFTYVDGTWHRFRMYGNRNNGGETGFWIDDTLCGGKIYTAADGCVVDPGVTIWGITFARNRNSGPHEDMYVWWGRCRAWYTDPGW